MKIVLESLLFIFGASFLKCFVDSRDLSFFYRRSKCDRCKKTLNFFELIPFVSFLLQRGRCNRCKKKIDINIFLYEVFGVIVACCYIMFSEKTVFLNFSTFFSVLLLLFISLEDIKNYEINTKLLSILLVINVGTFHFTKENIFLIVGVIFFYHALFFITKEKIGYGDIKLFLVLALNLDIFENIYLFSFTFFYAGVCAVGLLLFKKVNRKSTLPLAPFITLGYITILILRELILW